MMEGNSKFQDNGSFSSDPKISPANSSRCFSPNWKIDEIEEVSDEGEGIGWIIKKVQQDQDSYLLLSILLSIPPFSSPSL